MTWVSDTLDAWQAWYGASDPVAATRALTVALATVETWLDRPLELLEREQLSAVTGGGPVLLRAWPVASLAAVEVDGQAIDLDKVWLEPRTGRLFVPTWGPINVLYTGGYDPMPADLEYALWQVAAGLYPGMVSAEGAGIGPARRRVTTPDVGTIEYASSAADGGSSGQLLGATLSPQIEALLARYRAESAVGGA